MRRRDIEIGQRFNPAGRPARVFVVTGLKPENNGWPAHARLVVEDDPTEVRLIACNALRDANLWEQQGS